MSNKIDRLLSLRSIPKLCHTAVAARMRSNAFPTLAPRGPKCATSIAV
jgi:hypothetical protein